MIIIPFAQYVQNNALSTVNAVLNAKHLSDTDHIEIGERLMPDNPAIKYPHTIADIGDCDLHVLIKMFSKEETKIRITYGKSVALDMRISGDYLVFLHPEGSPLNKSPKEGTNTRNPRGKGREQDHE